MIIEELALESWFSLKALHDNYYYLHCKAGVYLIGTTRGWSWESRNRMRWLDSKILSHLPWHFHIDWVSDTFPFSFLAYKRYAGEELHTYNALAHSISQRLLLLMTLAAAGSPFRPARHPLAFSRATAKNRRGVIICCYIIRSIWPRSHPSFSLLVMIIYWWKTSCLDVHDSKMSARALLVQVIFHSSSFVSYILRVRARFIYTRFFNIVISHGRSWFNGDAKVRIHAARTVLLEWIKSALS